MNAKEHTRVLYLLDALRSAPGKAAQLLAMSEDANASYDYSAIIGELYVATHDGNVSEVAEEIRRRIL